MAEIIKLGSNGNWGVKPNGVLAYNDEDNVFKAIELQSSRASGATYVAQSGLIADAEVGVPRIDWTNGVGELLLEPQSTNLCLTSEDFSDANWSKLNSTISSDALLSPDGSVNADKLVENNTTNAHYIQDAFSITSGQSYTFSIFAKQGERTWIKLDSSSNGNWSAGAFFDLSNGVVGTIDSGSAEIISMGNGWYRCSITGLANANTSVGAQVILSTDGSTTSYLGDNTSGIYIFGGQIENLSYPTSYIRTSGTTETRIADAVPGNSSLGQVINSSEGVLYAEMSALVNDGTIRVLALNDGSTSNRIHLFYFVDANKIYVNYRVSNTSYALMEYTMPDALAINKIAYKFKSGDFALWVNGVEVDTDANTTMIPSGILDTIQFGEPSGSSSFYGRIRDLRVYDTALTDAQLQSLTTL